jgi:hypothetical protein
VLSHPAGRTKYQQVTLASRQQPAQVYQGHGDVDVWSLVLAGPNVPFAPFLADALNVPYLAGQDRRKGQVEGRHLGV